jgi:phospholipid transport system substrate-binding protein
MFLNKYSPTIVAIVALASPCVLAAPSESPETTLNRGLTELLSLAKGRNNTDPVELAKRVRPTLEKFFNFESLTRKALGAAWKDLTTAQQTQSVKLFSEIIIRSYTSKFDPSSQIEINFSKALDLGPGRKEVPATAKYQGAVVAVSYRVESAPDGWRVYDVIIEGISLASNYRAQFEAIRQKGGGDALIRAMEEKLK